MLELLQVIGLIAAFFILMPLVYYFWIIALSTFLIGTLLGFGVSIMADVMGLNLSKGMIFSVTYAISFFGTIRKSFEGMSKMPQNKILKEHLVSDDNRKIKKPLSIAKNIQQNNNDYFQSSKIPISIYENKNTIILKNIPNLKKYKINIS